MLCWQVRERGFQFIEYQLVDPTTTLSARHSIGPDFDWNPGFRVCLGYRDSCSRVYTSVTLSHYSNQINSNGNNDNNQALISAYFPDVEGVSVLFFNSQARWKMNYSTLDWEVGAPYCVTRQFIVTPFISLRGAIIDQQFNNYLTFIPIIDPGQEVSFIRKAFNDFTSLGIRGGLDIQSGLGCGFCLYGKGAFNVYYGFYRAKDKIWEERADIATQAVLFQQMFHIPRSVNRLSTNLDVAFGLQWSSSFCNYQNQLTFKFGYEFVYWYQQNELCRLIQPQFSRAASLGFQGVQFSGRYDF